MPDNSLSLYSSLSESEVIKSLTSSADGLSSEEARKRLIQNGPNSLDTGRKKSVFLEFLENFKSPLALILIGVSIISFFLGQYINSLIILAMVFMSIILNFFQEHRANQAAEKLKAKIALKTLVVRDGKPHEVPSLQIVVGDIIEVNAGDVLPADGRIISSKDLFVDQSTLTGESFPIEKHAPALRGTLPDPVNTSNLVFAGTSVVSGTARIIILKTGLHSLLGSLAEKVARVETGGEFVQGIQNFSNLILRITLIFVTFIFLANSFLKHDLLESLSFAIAVAVGLTPEFLPMIMSVNMSHGSSKMAKKGIIVKKLTAIPTLGSMDILCTDKTGTLTENHIHLIKYLDPRGHDSEEVFRHAYLNSFYQTGITNPMDQAVLEYKTLNTTSYSKIDEIPFDFERKRMSVTIADNNKHILISKGAPEEILAVSATFLDKNSEKKVTDTNRNTFLSQYETLSKDGYRVLALAKKNVSLNKDVYTKADEKNMCFLGFIAFIDPPKAGVKEAVDNFEAMNIEMKVLTGDNELVTQKICEEADIHIRGLMLGKEADELTDDELYHRSLQTTIFARFSPVQKNRIIEILRKNKHIVGFLGDGINDAPSLKSADVGISVDNGVDIAKESADIILTHKSLHELRDGVIEGRKTFGNTMKYVQMGLSSNFGNMFSVLGAVLFLPFLPMLPIQILLNNFLYDVGQITLPFDNVDEEYLRTPRRWDMKQIRNFMIIFGPISSLFDFLTYFVLYLSFKNLPGAFQTGWFMESLATQTLVIHIIRTQKIPFLQSNAHPLLWITTFTSVALGWIIPQTPLGHYFGFVDLSAHTIGLLVLIVFTYLLCVQLGKHFFYPTQKPNAIISS